MSLELKKYVHQILLRKYCYVLTDNMASG